VVNVWRKFGWPEDDQWAFEFGNMRIYVSPNNADIVDLTNRDTRKSIFTKSIQPSGDTMDERKANALILAADDIQREYIRLCKQLQSYRRKAKAGGIALREPQGKNR
jgi:hypothetical protein